MSDIVQQPIYESIDIIVDAKLKVLDFDKTGQYTIKDDSYADGRLYTVTDGVVSFDAYSISDNERYKIGDSVLVSIPKDDFSNPERTILRKTVKDDLDQAALLVQPFDRIIDVSGNLINKSNANLKFGLISNYWMEKYESRHIDSFIVEDKQYFGGPELSAANELSPQAINVADITDKDFLRYTKTCPYLGLSAKFTTDTSLGQSKAVSGEYGLIISIYVNGEDEPRSVGYISSKELFGDPLNYVVGMNAQKVFSIDNLTREQDWNITRIKIDFYQCGNFLNNKGKGYNLSSESISQAEEELIAIGIQGTPKNPSPNLFVSELYLCSAFLKTDYIENKVSLSSATGVNYKYSQYDSLITASCNFSWLNCEGDLPQLVYKKPYPSLQIRWYYEKMGAPGDKYSGAGWEFIKTTEEFSTKIILLKDVAMTTIKVVLVGKSIYTSNILNFINEDFMEKVSFENDLMLNYSDESNGIYAVYDLGNSLLDTFSSSEVRKLIPKFNSNNLVLSQITQLQWTFPNPKDSMFEISDWGNKSWQYVNGAINDLHASQDVSNISVRKDNTNIIVKTTNAEHIKNLINLPYSIKDKLEFNPQAYFECKIWIAKTTGQLADQAHVGSTTMQFLMQSTSGSPYTLLILSKDDKILTAGDLSSEVDFLKYKDESHTITLWAKMIDGHGEILTFEPGNSVDSSGQYQIEYTWKSVSYNDSGKKITDDGALILDNAGHITFETYAKVKQMFTNDNFGNYYVVEATVTPTGKDPTTKEDIPPDSWKRKIVSYYPVPVRLNSDYYGLAGTKRIVYDSAGKLQFSTFIPMDLNYKEDSSDNKIIYELKRSHTYGNDDDNFQISLNNSNALSPKGFFLNNYALDGYCIVAKRKIDSENSITVWLEPILLIQNHWASSLINGWDEKLTIDEEGNYILAAMMGAGTKDKNNKFSGVLMGNIKHVDSNIEESISQVGLYGFHNGDQAFAFKEDGTAFIGSGNGRLNFDGNDARIYNSDMVYSNGKEKSNGTGLLIDFDDALIHTSNIYSGENGDETPRQRHVYLNGFDPKHPFAIGDISYNKNNRTIDVTKANFYLDWDGNLKLSGSISPTGAAAQSINEIVNSTETIAALKEDILANYEEAAEHYSEVTDLVSNLYGNLQNQIDGSIDTYYFPGPPEMQIWYYNGNDITATSIDQVWPTDGNLHNKHIYYTSSINTYGLYLWDDINKKLLRKNTEINYYPEEDIKTQLGLTEENLNFIKDKTNNKDIFDTKRGSEGLEWYWKNPSNTINKRHIGDLYLDTFSGLGYRFLEISTNTFSWEPLDDAALQRALTEAANAQATADGKATVFLADDVNHLPTSDYQEGDICFTEDRRIFVCVNDNGTLKWIETIYNDNLEDFKNSLELSLAAVEQYLDGTIETWYYAYVPSNTKAPTKNWTTNEEKESHIGDLFYDTNHNKAYQYQKNSNNEYEWVNIEEISGDLAKNIIAALQKAAMAQDTADNKRRVFYKQNPTVPYDQGDLWITQEGNYTRTVNGVNKTVAVLAGEIYVCNTSRTSGNFDFNEWEPSIYTENYKTLIDNIGDLQAQIDSEIDIYVGTLNPPTKNGVYGNTITNTELKKKDGDLYYNTNTNKVYQFNGTERTWSNVTDTISNATIEALKNASDAQDLADGKRRIIYSSTAPTTNDYDLDNGDLWTNGQDIKIWYNGAWRNADNYKTYADNAAQAAEQAAADELRRLATGQYTYEPADLKHYFIEGNTIYSPRIFGGATLGVGYNAGNETYTSITEEITKVSTSTYVNLGNDVTKPSRWLINDDYNFRVYPTGGIGIGPVTLNSSDTTNARYNFMVDNSGSVFAKGTIYATSGDIGRWHLVKKNYSRKIDEDTTVYCDEYGFPQGSLYGRISDTNKVGDQGTIVLAPYWYGSQTIAGHSSSYWRLVIGSNFGVDRNGDLYANGGHFTGKITAQSGKIGNWEVVNGDTGSSTIPSVPNGSLCYRVSNVGENGSIALIPSGYLYEKGTSWTSKTLSIANHETEWWRLIIGSKFGVDYWGNLYANGGQFNGKIIANSGNIGGWVIQESDSYATKAGTLYYYSSTNGSWDQGYDYSNTNNITPQDNVLILSAAGFTNNISVVNSPYQKNWFIIAGSNFGLTKTGKCYIKNLRARGILISGSDSNREDGTIVDAQCGELAWIEYSDRDGIMLRGPKYSNNYGYIAIKNKDDHNHAGGIHFHTGSGDYKRDVYFNSRVFSFPGSSSTFKLYYGDNTVSGNEIARIGGNGSDKALKENISYNIDNIINFILTLQPCSFSYKDDSTHKTRFGFIAQDVQKNLENNNLDTDYFISNISENDQKYLGLYYTDFIAPIITVIQQQQQEIDSLKSELSDLKTLLKEKGVI